MREITLSQAVNEALAEEMRRDETVSSSARTWPRPARRSRCCPAWSRNSAPSASSTRRSPSPGSWGIAVGAAMTGARPIVDLMFGDFLFLIMDQLCNQAAKTHYMSGGKLNVPLVLRTNLGATRRSAAQHSQSLHALVAHIPGLKVALPSSAYEAKGLMKTAIRDNNPVVIFEDKLMYNDKAPVPEEEYLIPFGEANIKREGRDITLIGTSSMVQVCRKGRRDLLAKEGIERRGHRPAHHRAAGRGNALEIGEEDQPRHRRRRGSPELRRHRRDRLAAQRKGVLSPRCAGSAHGGHGRAGAVQPGAGGHHRADARGGGRERAQALSPGR
jgi:hypothetical protein